jgi:hypothetical protein
VSNEANRNGIVGNVMEKICHPIKWADVPSGRRLRSSARILGYDAELWRTGLKFLNNGGLRLTRCLRNQSFAPLAIN